MKILLVMSPMFQHDTHYLSNKDNEIPIGLCYVASSLEKAGYSAKILDGQIAPNIEKKLQQLIVNDNFSAVGFSAVSASASNARKLSKIVKKINPHILTIVGGVHPTVIGKKILAEMPEIDIAVMGEGEKTIVEIMECLCLKNKRSLSGIRGITYRKNGGIVQNPDREFIKDLDSIPFPAYHLIDISKYTPPPGLFFRKPIVGMISARGCPFNCYYCADRIIWRGHCRLRKTKFVLDEMELLAKKYGVREIKFFDDTFTINRQRTIDICNGLLERNLGLIWRCSSRVDTVDLELLKLMKKSGCWSISFGIESGSDEILKKMNKKITVKKIRQAVGWSRKAGIETKGFFMLNYPGDTMETTEKTIALSKELNLDFVGFNFTIPYLGTKVREEIEKKISKK